MNNTVDLLDNILWLFMMETEVESAVLICCFKWKRIESVSKMSIKLEK